MEKLPMCRICLVKNVRMYVVVNTKLHELYEKLTDIPFVTEDRRPILACFFCCTKLKQCCQLLRKCLEAEEQFAQMMKEDFKLNPLINQEHFEFYSRFMKSSIEHISIIDECQTESNTINEELPAVLEGLDDIIEPKEKHQNDELNSKNLDNSCQDVAEIQTQHSESDLGYDVPLIEFKTEVEEAGSLYNSCLHVADLPAHYSETDLGYNVPLIEFKTEVKEEVSKKEGRAGETKRATIVEKSNLDTRGTKQEDALTAEQTKKEKSDPKVILTTQNCTSKPGTYFKEPYKFDQHSFNRVKSMIQHCDVLCQSSFNHKTILAEHIRIHTGERPYKCVECQRSFIQKIHLKNHIRKHTGEKPYKCDICERSFTEKGMLTKHIRIHTGEKPYKCDVCQRSFSQRGGLTKHIRIHTGEKPYKCYVCQRSFSHQSNLTKHIRTHTGEKPYKCDLCPCSFGQKNILTKHIRIHTGEKPYKCDVCQRSFNQNSHLINHIRIHTGEKPYKCDICERSFSEKGVLTKHIRVHTGEKLF